MKKIDLKLVEGEFENPLKNTIRFPEQVFDIFQSLKDHASETLLVVYLGEDFSGIYDVHSTGTSSATTFDQHDLFGRAYITRARYIVLIHNHPSGNVEPSPQDLENWDTIRAYAEALPKLDALDFIIVGGDQYWSWYEENGGTGYEEGTIKF